MYSHLHNLPTPSLQLWTCGRQWSPGRIFYQYTFSSWMPLHSIWHSFDIVFTIHQIQIMSISLHITVCHFSELMCFAATTPLHYKGHLYFDAPAMCKLNGHATLWGPGKFNLGANLKCKYLSNRKSFSIKINAKSQARVSALPAYTNCAETARISVKIHSFKCIEVFLLEILWACLPACYAYAMWSP